MRAGLAPLGVPFACRAASNIQSSGVGSLFSSMAWAIFSLESEEPSLVSAMVLMAALLGIDLEKKLGIGRAEAAGD